MNKFTKKVLVIVGSIVTFLVLMYGFVAGFYPFEHNIIIRNAKRYVIETYGLTPTDVEVINLYLWFPVMVRVETEEDDFWFHLRTGRFHYSVTHFGDNYVERMAEHVLTKDLRAYVENITNGQGRVWASVTGGFISPQLRAEPGILENPNIVFEKLRGQYIIGITLFDGVLGNEYRLLYDLDFDLVYSIFTKIFELGLEPRDISFSYNNIPGVQGRLIYSALIQMSQFPDITSPEDLISIFEEDMNTRIGWGW